MTKEEYGAAYTAGLNLTTRSLVARGIPFDAAGEFAQTAWLRGWERLKQLREPEMLLMWINTIALNLYRSEYRKGQLPLVGGNQGQSTISLKNIDKEIDVELLLRLVNAEERAILRSHYLNDNPVKEIAGRMEKSETAVRIRLLRARKKIKKKFNGRTT